MSALKADIITQLKKDILALQGFKNLSNVTDLDIGLGALKYAFPNSSFPLGVIHEFICPGMEEISASTGFVSGILSSLMSKGGVSFWIGPSFTIFPPALRSFGIDPANIIFVNLRNQKDILWTIEEVLKCNGLAAVIGEISNISFNESRRLQLAVEQSKVTGFILRHQRNLNTTACVTRWKISHLPSMMEEDLPGVGFPRWNVELLKVRNGKPGSWQMEWKDGRFRHTSTINSIQSEQHKKAG